MRTCTEQINMVYLVCLKFLITQMLKNLKNV